ncbi:MAG TPA: hypothetical protein VN457_06160, partial [Chlamydiales bacterium]|nr:hypothetical protein [Chlamydiales bacterium]
TKIEKIFNARSKFVNTLEKELHAAQASPEKLAVQFARLIEYAPAIIQNRKTALFEVVDAQGNNALMKMLQKTGVAYSKQQIEHMQYIIAALSEKQLVMRNADGFTALDEACLHSEPDSRVVQAFVDAKKTALFGVTDAENETVLHKLCTGLTSDNLSSEHIAIAKILVAHMTPEQVRGKNIDGKSAEAILQKTANEIQKELQAAKEDYEAVMNDPQAPEEEEKLALLEYESLKGRAKDFEQLILLLRSK